MYPLPPQSSIDALNIATPNLADLLAALPIHQLSIDALNTATPNLADLVQIYWQMYPHQLSGDALNTTTPNLADHSQDAAVELNGRVNEGDIFVGDIQVTALIDTGAQVSTITQDFCEAHRYDIHPAKQILCLEGTWRFSIPYLKCIEATVKIPPIKDYDECVPMLNLKSSSLIVWGFPYSLALLCWTGLWPG